MTMSRSAALVSSLRVAENRSGRPSPKKGDVCFDQGVALVAARDFLPEHHLFGGRFVPLLPALHARGAVEVAVSGDQQVIRHPSHSFYAVNVLRVHPYQLSFLGKEGAEVVSWRRKEVVGVKLPREQVEGLGVVVEEMDVEHAGRRGKVVLLQIVVQTSPRCPEIWNAA